jgi:restriction system protein
MSIPAYEDFMLPILRILADGGIHRRRDIAKQAADALQVPPADQELMLPSGKAPIYLSRAGWALTYLKQAQLIEVMSRGAYRITARGRVVVESGVQRVDANLLEQFPEFREFLGRERSQKVAVRPEATPLLGDGEFSPEENLTKAYRILRTALAAQLLDTLKSVEPSRFEEIVIDVLQAMGYGGGREGAARAIGRVGDGGIDGILEEDRLGLDTVYVQAKRWAGNVGRPDVQAFAGALQGQRASKGVMITTSGFSSEAKDYVRALATRIVLVDGQRLAEMMIDHDVGVSVEATYTIKRVDSDYFDE